MCVCVPYLCGKQVLFQSPEDGTQMMLTPEMSMALQNQIGADIMMVPPMRYLHLGFPFCDSACVVAPAGLGRRGRQQDSQPRAVHGGMPPHTSLDRPMHCGPFAPA